MDLNLALLSFFFFLSYVPSYSCFEISLNRLADVLWGIWWKSRMQWQSQTQQNSVYKLHMISKLSASSCWGFLQIILFWLPHPSAGKVWVIGLQLVLHCNPSFRSTIVKRYLCFWKTNKKTLFLNFFFFSLILGNWLLLLPACSHSWGNWRFHVIPAKQFWA